MGPRAIVVLSLFMLWVLFRLATDRERALRLAIAGMVALPALPMVELPGDLPNFAVHRFIVIFLLIAWVVSPRHRPVAGLPFLKPMLALAAVNLFSVVLSPFIVESLKDFLVFTVEGVLFYIVAATWIKDEEEAKNVLRAALAGLTVVASLGLLERYVHLPATTLLDLPREYRDLLATYPHRILLGSAMAMGFPLAIGLYASENKRRFFVQALLCLGTCYLAMSRGPWVAVGFAMVVLYVLGKGVHRRTLLKIGVLAALLLIARPGVKDTITSLAESTFDPGSAKGSSYEYRWELWKKAYREISVSPTRMVFGFGPGNSEVLDLTEEVYYKGFRTTILDDFWSWDNDYAAQLLETGFLGLGLLAYFQMTVLLHLWRRWQAGDDPQRNLLAGITASVVVLMFMMTNVKIFAPQLKFLFLTLIACATRISSFQPGKARQPMPARPSPPALRARSCNAGQ